MARHRTSPHLAFSEDAQDGRRHFEATHLEPKVDVCDKHYVFDAQQPNGSKPFAFDPTGKCPAFVANSQIARAALGKQHTDDIQYAQLVTANTPVAPIHSGLDGGMNRVFLAQVGGSIPPARVPPSKSQPPPPPDDNGSFASRLFGLFGWRSAPQTQIASADSRTLERGAHSPATGSILATKTKLAPQVYAVADATSSGPYKNESAKSDILEMQQTVAGQPKSVLLQVVNAAWSLESDDAVSSPPTEPTEVLRKPLERIAEVQSWALNLTPWGAGFHDNLYAPIPRDMADIAIGNATYPWTEA